MILPDERTTVVLAEAYESYADTTGEDKRSESETASAESGGCRSGLAGMQWSVLTACAAAMPVSAVLLRRRRKHSKLK